MVWEKPQNQLFCLEFSTMVTCKGLLGSLEYNFKTSSNVKKEWEFFNLCLNSLPTLLGKSDSRNSKKFGMPPVLESQLHLYLTVHKSQKLATFFEIVVNICDLITKVGNSCDL